MKTFEITKEQILELSHNDYRLKEWFPQAFEPELEVGKWYKFEDKNADWWLACIADNDLRYYGFNSLKWFDTSFYPLIDKNANNYTLATEEEVKNALIAEAKKRGFKEGVTFRADWLHWVWTKKGNISFEFKNNQLRIYSDISMTKNDGYIDEIRGSLVIFKNGKWAEIISEPIELTLEQIAEKFNVNVEQLKIKK